MDEMFRLLWQRYRAWADTAARLKKWNAAWKRNVLTLTVVGTTLATLGPFASGGAERMLPIVGAVALALAVYFGKELLDPKHEDKWTRARAAAEALKSEAHKYLVQAAPYHEADRVSRLKSRMEALNDVTRGLAPDDILPDRASKGMPVTWWTVDDYLAKRLQEQIDWYRSKAIEHTKSMARGRLISLTLGGLAVVLSAATGVSPDGASVSAAVLAVVTTTGGSLGSYFQAGHYEAIAVKYRETAEALATLKAGFITGAGIGSKDELVSAVEAIMQAENAAWLTELTVKATT